MKRIAAVAAMTSWGTCPFRGLGQRKFGVASSQDNRPSTLPQAATLPAQANATVMYELATRPMSHRGVQRRVDDRMPQPPGGAIRPLRACARSLKQDVLNRTGEFPVGG